MTLQAALKTVEERVRRGLDKPRGERLPSIGNVPTDVTPELRLFLETVRQTLGGLRQKEDAVVFMSDLQRIFPQQVGSGVGDIEIQTVTQREVKPPPQSGSLIYAANGDLSEVVRGDDRISFQRNENGDIINIEFPTYTIELGWLDGRLIKWSVLTR
jgi:hypothetical protein